MLCLDNLRVGKMEVEVVSKEIIKPSSPTPHDLRIFKLSRLDQLIPSPYAPIILFYHNYGGSGHLEMAKRLKILKESLSKTLKLFYPLGGTIKDDLSIECNDEGVYYVEARVNCSLHGFLSQPDLLQLHRLLPCEPAPEKSKAGTHVSNVQVNLFECSGLAIGLCISHKILDGAALSNFLRAWSAIARGLDGTLYAPNFMASSMFPANDLWLRDTSMVTWGSLFKKGNCVTRRLLFNASAISALKGQAMSSKVQFPTRVEVVSAFIWKSTMAAASKAAKHGSNRRPSLMSHLVNLRRRMCRVLSENSIGNLLWLAAARCPEKHKTDLEALVAEMREAVTKIDIEFVQKLQSYEGNSVISESLKYIREEGSKEGADFFGFSSWCKLGFYEADFGWGKPSWVSSIGLEGSVFMNLIILVDTESGDGIEAWVTLDEEEMSALERDQELLTYASMDPSPLKMTTQFMPN